MEEWKSTVTFSLNTQLQLDRRVRSRVDLRVLSPRKRCEPYDDHLSGWINIDCLTMHTTGSEGTMFIIKYQPHTMITAAFKRFVPSLGKGLLAAAERSICRNLRKQEELA